MDILCLISSIGCRGVDARGPVALDSVGCINPLDGNTADMSSAASSATSGLALGCSFEPAPVLWLASRRRVFDAHFGGELCVWVYFLGLLAHY